jgi:hypothetical protein
MLRLVQTVVDEVARSVDDVLAIMHSLMQWPFVAPGGGIDLLASTLLLDSLRWLPMLCARFEGTCQRLIFVGLSLEHVAERLRTQVRHSSHAIADAS